MLQRLKLLRPPGQPKAPFVPDPTGLWVGDIDPSASPDSEARRKRVKHDRQWKAVPWVEPWVAAADGVGILSRYLLLPLLL